MDDLPLIVRSTISVFSYTLDPLVIITLYLGGHEDASLINGSMQAALAGEGRGRSDIIGPDGEIA